MTATKPPISTRSTPGTSRRSASTAHKPLQPFTTDHYRQYARLSVLDSGEFFDPEDWELELVGDLFAGTQENWWVLPEGSGKTTFVGHLGLYYGDFTPMANIPVAASSREQAEIMYRQAEGFVVRTPALRKRFRCYSGYRRVKCHRTEGRIQVYAADDRTADGVIPGGLALVDELHRHRDLKLYRTWRGKLEKRGAQLVTISTAGEPGGEFEETRSRIKRDAIHVSSSAGGCHVRAAGDNIVLHDFAVPEARFADDMEVVARANPRSEITPAVLERKRSSPTMTREHWLRFVCNIATLTGGSAILPEEWDRLEEQDPSWEPGSWRCQWLDLGWKIDTTAGGVLIWESEQRRIVTGVQIIQPPVNESDVVAGILRRQIDYDADTVVLDPNAGGEQMVQMLEKSTHPLQTNDELRIEYGLPPLEDTRVGELDFIAHSQDNAPMIEAAGRLDEAIRLGWLVHDGDRNLRRHVLNAVARRIGDAKWKYDRPPDAQGQNRKNYPIDALTGVLMGHNIAVNEAGQGNEFVFEVLG
jgi:phage terminase large subunit-like protein